jgi:hypothetical protein
VCRIQTDFALGTLTVRNLKNMLQRVLRVPAHKQQIYCVTKAADEVMIVVIIYSMT